MKLKVIQQFWDSTNNKLAKEGSTIEASDKAGKRLIERGLAKKVTTARKKK